MPYQCQGLFDKDDKADLNPYLDVWSVGVTILEIICGTELIIGGKSFEAFEKLLEEMDGIVDERTLILLKAMMNTDDTDGISNYVLEVLDKNPSLIAENIRAMNAAFEEVTFFREAKENNRRAIRQMPERYRANFDLEADHLEEEGEHEDRVGQDLEGDDSE